ncbi:MAG: hypothetical protein JNM34_03225 [Chthonomonadaceae bacterium]|nr:hypothetical protein [Chthonomonadaceae bacterium]
MSQGRLFVTAAMALVCVAANAQSQSFLGPTVGIFFPSDSKLREKLGDAWFSFGASRVKIDPYAKQHMAYDWETFSKSKDGSKVFMVAGTVGVIRPFGSPGAMTRPYGAIRGGLSYIDYAVDTTNVLRVSGKRLGFNANAEFGINIGERLNLSARYDLFPSYEGLKFSGLTIAVKWGVTKF